MKVFKVKKIEFFILLTTLIFFIVPNSEVLSQQPGSPFAPVYSCNVGGRCDAIDGEDFAQAKSNCVNIACIVKLTPPAAKAYTASTGIALERTEHGSPDRDDTTYSYTAVPCSIVLGQCPVFGCIFNKNCVDIPAYFFGDYLKKSCFGEPLATPCPLPKAWACFETEKCHNVQARFYQEAKDLCPKGEPAKTQESCAKIISSDKALEEKYGALAGTSLTDLQKTAAAKLNPAQLSDPKMLVSRAINFLTGILGSITLLLYVVAGFLWMTAHGASEQVDRAKKIMVWTTLGVVVMLFSYMLTTMLFDFIPKLSL